MKLLNVNWPTELQEKVIKLLSANDASVRTMTHRDKISRFCFHMLEIEDIDELTALYTIQDAFKQYFRDNTVKAPAIGFTYDSADYIATSDGTLIKCDVLRNVTMPSQLVSQFVNKVNIGKINMWFIQYANCVSFFIRKEAFADVLDTLAAYVEDKKIRGEALERVTYYYKTQCYALPNKVRIKAHATVEHKLNMNNLPTAIVGYIIKSIKWYAQVPVTIDDNILIATMPGNVFMKALTVAYQTYLLNEHDPEDYPFTVNGKVYCLAYSKRNCIPVAAMRVISDKSYHMREVADQLSKDNVYSIYQDKTYYIDLASWPTAQQLMQKYDDMKWSVA